MTDTPRAALSVPCHPRVSLSGSSHSRYVINKPRITRAGLDENSETSSNDKRQKRTATTGFPATTLGNDKTMHILTQGLNTLSVYSCTGSRKLRRYSSSTFFLAQGVLRRKFKLERMLGLWLKQFMGIKLPISAQPYRSTR